MSRVRRGPREVARELAVLLWFRLGAGGASPGRSIATGVALTGLLGVGLPLSVATWAPRDAVGQVLAVTPTLWAFVLAAAVVASLASAGGRELLPRRQSVALPVSATVDQLGALLLTPLNVAWSLQATVLLSGLAYLVGPRWLLLPAAVGALLWLLAATAVGQLVGWLAELLRTYRAGVMAVRAAGVAVGASAVAVVAGGRVGSVLDALPTTWVFVGAVSTDPARYVATQVLVLSAAVGCVALTVPVTAALERRPRPDESRGETRRHARSRPRSPFVTTVLVDARSVLRSPPLRRGLVVLLTTPLAVALLLPLPWLGIIVLPGLVASGTALLHGVNLVALDGRGALWRESLPHLPDRTLSARLLVLTLLCGVPSAGLVLVAGLRADPPSAAELAAACVTVVVSTLQVVSRCARWSVRHPYPAELRHGRDIPAPHAAMAGYSVRLSAVTTLSALLVGAAALLDRPALAVVIGLALVAPSLLRLRAALVRHDAHDVRARLVTTVAGA